MYKQFFILATLAFGGLLTQAQDISDEKAKWAITLPKNTKVELSEKDDYFLTISGDTAVFDLFRRPEHEKTFTWTVSDDEKELWEVEVIAKADKAWRGQLDCNLLLEKPWITFDAKQLDQAHLSIKKDSFKCLQDKCEGDKPEFDVCGYDFNGHQYSIC
ncbi:uncharacterized protein L201_005442 [Kwoniella dendrophila CBS 6074]|uniref:Uncharacterized protein n=1 Tax=Kwoniella dendrophila CBS 6074 TaxID=1295534 RepID=A0AAX4JYE3_9TREE